MVSKDNADIVNTPWPDFVTERDWDWVEGGKCCEEISAYVDRVVARLVAAEAERDRAQERGNTWREHFENTNAQLNRKQVECDDLIVRVLAAEAEVKRIKDAAQWLVNNRGHRGEEQAWRLLEKALTDG